MKLTLLMYLTLIAGLVAVPGQIAAQPAELKTITRCVTFPHIEQSPCLPLNRQTESAITGLLGDIASAERSERDLRGLPTFLSIEPRYSSLREEYRSAIASANCREAQCIGQLSSIVRDFSNRMQMLGQQEEERRKKAWLENEKVEAIARQQAVNAENEKLKREEAAERKKEALWAKQDRDRRFNSYSKTLKYIYFPFWMATFTFFIWRVRRLHNDISHTSFMNRTLKDFEKGLDKNQKAILNNFAVPQAEGLRASEFRTHVTYPGLACLISLLGAYIGSRELVGAGLSLYVSMVFFWAIVGYGIFTVIFSYLKYRQIEGPLLMEKLDAIAGSYGCSKCKSDFSVCERKVGEDILYAVPQQRSVTKKDSSGNFYTTHENWTDVRVKEHMSRDCIKCGANRSWKQETVRRENYSTRRSG